MPSKEICPKCGEEFIESTTTAGTSIYMYKGSGETKMKAVSDGKLCSPCVSVMVQGWKYPIEFRPDIRKSSK